MASNAFSAEDSEIRAKAQEVIDYWFDELGSSGWYKKDPDRDREIKERWSKLRKSLIASDGKVWREGPKRILAAVILIDQFSRNIYRGKAEAFEHDPLARRLTRRAIAKEWDLRMKKDHRHFLYMPLMHSEDIDDQDESVRLFDAMNEDGHSKFAHLHRQQIVDYGRFPGRNKALGRESTPEELIALEGGAAF